MKVEAVIFDMDGVLIDSENFYHQRRLRFLEKKGFDIRKIPTMKGSNEKAIWEQLVPEDKTMREKLKLEYREYRKIDKLPVGELLNIGVQQVFKELHDNGIKVGIASSSERVVIREVLEVAKVANYVDYYISGEQCKCHKPDPEIYQRAIQKLQVDGKCTLAVEDSNPGMKSALNAGLTVIGFGPDAKESAMYCKYQVNNLKGVLKVVNREMNI